MLLRGGLVADGIGTRLVPADVLTDGPVIASVGPGATPDGGEVIDLAPGSVVCPGFIDAHVHAEGPLLADGRVDGALAQGVTTLVVGQDGQSWVGATAATAHYLNRYFAPVNGALEPARGLSLAAYREAVAGRLTQNVAVLASQGTIRHNVAGLARRPLDPAERPAARSTARSRTGRSACPAGWTTCPAGSAPPERSPPSRGRWRTRSARTFRICGPMAATPGPGWTSWWRWGAPPGSGCTPAICGAA